MCAWFGVRCWEHSNDSCLVSDTLLEKGGCMEVGCGLGWATS